MDLSPYRNIRERQLRHEGLFLAEGRLVVERLLTAGWPLHSVVCTPELRLHYADAVGRYPLYTLGRDELAKWVGFAFHRGVLAAGIRRPFPNAPALLQSLKRPRLIAVCVDLVDAENLGAIIRSAAALGADAVVLSSQCADVLGRRVIRTSMGAVFRMPIAVMRDDRGETRALREMGFRLIATTPDPSAATLATLSAPPPLAVLLGNEGSGLSEDWLEHCDDRIRIPMTGTTDSLNVSVAAGIVLYSAGLVVRKR